VLETTIVAGKTKRSNCRPTSGQVEVCNYRYGSNGWLGLAQIWISGSHIVQGTSNVNDTYFNRARYNTRSWRNMVMCQEVGHTLGLDHQDEAHSNTNLGTCMEYTNDPSGTLGTNGTLSNEHPNAHDYKQLEAIYTHRPQNHCRRHERRERNAPCGEPGEFQQSCRVGPEDPRVLQWAARALRA
jgi:hypothetical protein